MRGRTQRTTEPKTPQRNFKHKFNSEVFKREEPQSPGEEKKQDNLKGKKKEVTKSKGAQGDKPREGTGIGMAHNPITSQDQGSMAQMPTKLEVMEMFAKLENSIKSEITNVRGDGAIC